MADNNNQLARLAEGIRRANAAGNVEQVKILGAEYRRLQAIEAQAVSPDQGGAPPEGAVPGSREYADWAAQQARAGKTLPQVGPMPPEQQGGGLLDNIAAGGYEMVNSVPVAGPWMADRLKDVKAGIHGTTREAIDADTERLVEENPAGAITGGVAGAVLPFFAGGAIPGVAKVLGMAPEMSIGARMLAGGLSGVAIGGADTVARGGSGEDVATSAGIQGGMGVLAPGIGLGISRAARAFPKAANWALGGIPGLIRDSLDTSKAARQMIGRTIAADRKAGQALTANEAAAARARGQQLINLDLGGPSTRKLARVSVAKSPEARANLAGALDRGAPGTETGRFLTRLVGGSADDIALREGLRDAARQANRPAYAAAYNSPAAAHVWNPQIEQLFQSRTFQTAVRSAERSSGEAAALNGGRVVQNPFVFDKAGNVTLKPGVSPTLEFWDHVQRNLRLAGERLAPTARTEKAGIDQLRGQLNSILDAAVPEFGQARKGAAAFFGAEDAMDAGRQFALQPRSLPEARQAFAAMSPPEQQAFAIGAASSVLDKLGTSETYGVVKSAFGSPAAKGFWRMVLGPGKAAELEGYVKVQGIMNASKEAIAGNSHTYDLLAAGGLAGGLAGNYFNLDPRITGPMIMFGALRMGRSTLGRKVDQKVAEQVAELLASGGSKALNTVIYNAGRSPRWADAVDVIFDGLSRGAGSAVMQKDGPIEITVRGGSR